MPSSESLTRRRFLANISLLAPLSAIAACRPWSAATGSTTTSHALGPARAAHTTWAMADGRVTVYATGSAGEQRVALCWFNDVGGRIWRALDGTRDPAELARVVGRALGLDAEQADIEDATLFVVELAKLGLVEGGTHFTLSRAEVSRAV